MAHTRNQFRINLIEVIYVALESEVLVTTDQVVNWHSG
jgi:hypothetical protein